VEYFATGLGNLLEGRFVRHDRITIAADAVGVGVAIAVALLMVRLLPPLAAISLAIGLAGAWIAGTQALFIRDGIWLSAIAPPLALALTVIGALSGRLITARADQRDSAARERNLRRYVAPALADDLAQQERPSYHGRNQSAAVLFTDIAGFTKISEAIGPKKTAALLQAFHEKVETAVNENGGVLTTFLGDGAMAVFGLPEPLIDDPVRALAAARALVRDMDAWAPLRIGVGVHYGPVTIAQLGGRSQRQMTATGDTVNLASRLESLTRHHDALIAISASVVEAVRSKGRDDLLAGLQHAAKEQVKGRREPVDVWLLPARSDKDARGAA
jgi:adenylate cyclase